jgi:hypothetical protein
MLSFVFALGAIANTSLPVYDVSNDKDVSDYSVSREDGSQGSVYQVVDLSDELYPSNETYSDQNTSETDLSSEFLIKSEFRFEIICSNPASFNKQSNWRKDKTNKFIASIYNPPLLDNFLSRQRNC